MITDFQHHLQHHCGPGCSCTQDWGLDMFCRGECGEGEDIELRCWTCDKLKDNSKRFCKKMGNKRGGRFYCHDCQSKQFKDDWSPKTHCINCGAPN